MIYNNLHFFLGLIVLEYCSIHIDICCINDIVLETKIETPIEIAIKVMTRFPNNFQIMNVFEFETENSSEIIGNDHDFLLFVNFYVTDVSFNVNR
jgi:hypothetical protein